MTFKQFKEYTINPTQDLTQKSSPLKAIFEIASTFAPSDNNDSDSVVICVEKTILTKLQETITTIEQDTPNSIVVRHLSSNCKVQNDKLEELLLQLAQLKAE